MLYSIIISPIEFLIETAYTFFSVVVRYNPVFPVFGISVLITLLCLPLYIKAESIQNEERHIQNRMKAKIASIKKQFSGNEKYMILSMYYRENNYHPIMGLRSALSLLLQIPFFIAAYNFISNLEGLKGTSFLFIQDLGRPDGLLSFNPNNSYSVNILPIIMTLINLISGYVYAKNYDNKEKLQLAGMSIVFLLLLYNSPSALVLYWTFNNVFSLLKNIVFKFKKPGHIFYSIIAIFLFCGCVYVFFFRSQGKSYSLIFKLLSIITSLIILSFPFFFKFFNYLGKKYFYHLNEYKINIIRQIFILSIFSLWIFCGLIIPLNVISSDTAAFSFLGNNSSPFSLFIMSACVSFGFLVFWPFYIFTIYHKKIKIIFTFLFSLLLLSGIFNFFLFMGDNGTLSSTLTFNSTQPFDYSLIFILVNFLSFIIIFLIISLVFKNSKIKILSSMFKILLLSCFFIIIWKVTVIQREYNSYKIIRSENESKNIQSNQVTGSLNNLVPVFNFSKKGKNVIIIMLDRAVGSYFPIILDERPEFKTIYSGFTYYPNTISFFRATILGTPPIFGSYEYTPEGLHTRKDIAMSDKHDEALLLMPYLFMENNYNVSVFDLPYVNYKEPMNISFFTKKNINAGILSGKFYNRFITEFPEKKPLNSINFNIALKHNFVFFSIIGIAPPYLRSVIYRKGNYWTSKSAGNDDTIPRGIVSEYATLYYLPQISSYNNDNDTLTIIVNNLTHEPSYLQYPDYDVVSRITDVGPERFSDNITSKKHFHVNIASYILLAHWFEELKNNGVYNNTRIIIVSDHDEILVKPLFSDELNRINTFYNPILLVKDFNNTDNLKTDFSFMTTADVPLIALSGIIENPKNPFTGNLLKADKDNGVNIYLGGSAYMRDFQGWEALDKTSNFYHVKENIFDAANWTRITKHY